MPNPISPDVAEDYAMSADLLNTLWEELGSEYDQYYNTMSVTSRNAIQKALSDWQDWYYGNWDDWGPSDKWQDVYSRTLALLDAEKAKGARRETPVDLPPQQEVIELPPEYIYGRVPEIPDIVIDPISLPPPPPPRIIDPDAYSLDYEIPEYEIVELDYGKKPTNWGLILGALAAGLILTKGMG